MTCIVFFLKLLSENQHSVLNHLRTIHSYYKGSFLYFQVILMLRKDTFFPVHSKVEVNQPITFTHHTGCLQQSFLPQEVRPRSWSCVTLQDW